MENRKQRILSAIEKLKQTKPPGWQAEAKKYLRVLQHECREDDFREVIPNADRMGYESVGRKLRSTRIQPPI